MFYVKFNNKDNSDAKVYIKHSYSVNGVKKQLVIEKYDSINQLTKEILVIYYFNLFTMI